jgi:methionyl-tRNA formyltransferase
MSSLRVIFAGTPAFAVPTFHALLDKQYKIVAVYTQPDRPAGRGQRPQWSAVKQAAIEASLPIEQPVHFSDPGAVATLCQYQADILVVIAYGLLLPAAVLAAPRLGGVNLHASLLPRWRGAAPIQRALLAGDSCTGVDLMQMETGLDTGPIYARRELMIDPKETAASLHDKLSICSAELLVTHLPDVATGRIQPCAQETQGITYAHKITKAEAVLDWHWSALALERKIRAFNPWPIAQTNLHQQRVRIWESDLIEQETTAPPGTVIAVSRAGIDVATGQGCLRITRLQRAGRRPVMAAEFIQGQQMIVGQQFQ